MKRMAGAHSISLSKFTSSVQAAVTAAQERNPKFTLPRVEGVTFSALIRGIPVPYELAQKLTLGEMQNFADEVAGHLGGLHPELAAVGSKAQGMFVSAGHHILCGIPPVTEAILLEK